MRGRLWVCVVSHAAGNHFEDIACVCGLISSVICLPLVSFLIDLKPSYCIGSDAWRQAGLALPPDSAVMQGWKAVLDHFQEVSICIFIAEFAPSLRPSIPLLKIRL
jgi:hypothetical protein